MAKLASITKLVFTKLNKIKNHYFLSASFASCASFSTCDLMPILRRSSISSPFWCFSRRMSQPPMNSPSMKICGIVGQLVKSLMFFRSSSEESTSCDWKGTPCILSTWTTALLKPQRGASGMPFIKTTTLSLLTIFEIESAS